ncbi:ABC-F family ATP-binding cassette domain-containing protein [Hymenobacter taeanensis]|uniref:ABC-F family ATP-binding cassette domain-containing protein n=1 Tax=Hymenobacter taeanensis TaxID=2735321 RepID=A0A6M6BDP6_9BACT|nr:MULTISPECIES: ABC-F family ATP-binding cassette domain-containing protein [Hymenobacter]QJX45413.1 ABC-F family ATP-binding cassette domain-containing protein [Hymenobacter taeanensis]UOQ81344.1 ABC-F family ATP-binding cassette domain-containing protein [Hymenobacter sp. 5414T-23]
MNLLSAENLSKNYADRWLFRELNFGLQQGQRVALVGINGSGKTTLLRILAGLEPPDTGEVSVRKDIRVSFLGQQPVFDESLNVEQTIFASQNDTLAAIRDYEHVVNDPNHSSADLQRVMELMDTYNAWDYDAQVKQILGRLGILGDLLERPVSKLSGGQRKRVALARVLIEEPDVLILDEPTNHLDLATIEWLENRLASPALTLLMVTHDRYFLDKVANEIVELDQGRVHRYQGNYSYFVEKKAEREQMETVEVEKARNLLRKELEWMRRQPQARGTKQKARIDAFYDTQEKAKGRIKGPEMELSVKTTRQGGKIIEVEHLHKQFGGKVVLDDFSYVFKKKDRIGLIGPNGAGKSTLLNMLTGKLTPDSGVVDAGQTTVFGYYTQTELEFDPTQRVIDIVKEVAEVVEMADGSQVTASQFLQHFQFPPAQQYTLVSKLSGGEKRRLQLLRVLIKNPNFLILDEPTNDLDIITLNILEDFLLNFQGCLIIVSHDRYFMDALVEQVFALEPGGKIRQFPGNYTDYREWQKDQDAETAARPPKATASAAPVAVPPTPAAAPAAAKRKATFAEKKEYETLEKELEQLETLKQQLIEKLNSGTGTHQELADWAAQLKRTDLDLDTKGERWLELAEFV